MWFEKLKLPHWIGIIALFIALRWAAGGFDFSFFMYAGSNSCDSTLQQKIKVQPGFCYDGEYFYRYALAPLNTENPYHGIFVTTAPYRHQRIFYSFLTWLITLGGIPVLVPFGLVLVNFLCFGAFLLGLRHLLSLWKLPPAYLIIGVLISGLWMGLARDLAEPTELCLFIYLLLSFEYKRPFLFMLIGTALLLTREPSGITLATFCFVHLYQFIKRRQPLKESFIWILSACVPVLLFLLFRNWIIHQYPQQPGMGHFNLNWLPFKGIMDGLLFIAHSIQTTTLKGCLILVFWVAQLLLMGAAFSSCYKSMKGSLSSTQKWLTLLVATWIVFVLFLSKAMWETDWGFARALAVPYLSALLLAASTGRLPRWQINATTVFVAFLLLRLIAKV
jgi:hypothetical protein